MELFTKKQKKKLLDNGSPENRGKDHCPVVKWFTPDANATWLITEIDPNEPDLAFGLCDLGLGFPELGYVSIEEIKTVKGVLGLPIERDLFFEATHPISVYADAAHSNSGIVEDDSELDKFDKRDTPNLNL